MTYSEQEVQAAVEVVRSLYMLNRQPLGDLLYLGEIEDIVRVVLETADRVRKTGSGKVA